MLLYKQKFSAIIIAIYVSVWVEIPKNEIKNRATINLCDKYAKYKIEKN